MEKYEMLLEFSVAIYVIIDYNGEFFLKDNSSHLTLKNLLIPFQLSFLQSLIYLYSRSIQVFCLVPFLLYCDIICINSLYLSPTT